MNRPHLNLQHVLLGSAWLALSLLTPSCERIDDPAPTVEVVDLDTAGRSTTIFPKGSPGNLHYENISGDVLFDGQTFFEAQPFNYGYAVVAQKIEGQIRYGAIDARGRTAVPIIHYTPIFGYENGLFKIGLAKIGYLDSTGATVIPAEYSATHGIDGNLVTLQNSTGKWGILNRQGEEIVPFEFREIGPWADDRAAVAIDAGSSTRWGYIDRSGKRIIPCEYAFATAFDQGVALEQKAGKYAVIDAQGKLLTPFEYDDFQMFAEEIPHSSVHPELPNKTRPRLVSSDKKIKLQKEGKWIQFSIDNL